MWRTALLILSRPFAVLIYLIVCGFVYLCAIVFEWYGNPTTSLVWKQVREFRISCREFLLPPISHSARV